MPSWLVNVLIALAAILAIFGITVAVNKLVKG